MGNGQIRRYNAIGFDEKDRYLYGVSEPYGPEPKVSDLVQIGEDGSVDDLGPIGNLPPPTNPLNGYHNGAFFNGTFYVMAFSNVFYKIDLANRKAAPITASGTWGSSDFTQVGNYLWGINANGFQRLDPATGVMRTFPQTAVPVADAVGGAVWTYGNGNFGVSSNGNGVVSQIEIDNPGSDDPKFRLISQAQGLVAPGNDGASCLSKVSDTDLSIVKSGPLKVDPGETITWRLRVTNHGPANSSGSTVTDEVPADVTNVASATPGCTVVGNTVTCRIGPLAVAQTSTDIVLTGTAPMAEECVVNSASVLPHEHDPIPSNNTSAGVLTCTGDVADLSIVKRVSPSPAVPGRNVTYTLEVHNAGPDRAERVVVSDPLPVGLSFVSAGPGCGFAGGTVTCRLASLRAGDSESFTVVVRLASSLTVGVVNTARVKSNTLDPDLSNNYSTVSTPLGRQADLGLTKASSAPTMEQGGQLSYTLVVINHGPSDAGNVTVSDPLHAGLSLVSAIPSQGSCTGPRDVLCHLGALPAGGSAQILVTVRVAHTFTGSIENVAVVAGGNPDPEPANNTARQSVIVPPPPPPRQPVSNLRIVKTVDHRRAHPGRRLTYTLEITNEGPDAAPQVIAVTDTATLPLQILSMLPSRGVCMRAHPVRCSLGRLAAGAGATITIVARPTRSGTIRNTASVTSANHDPMLADNISTVRTSIISPRPPRPRFTG